MGDELDEIDIKYRHILKKCLKISEKNHNKIFRASFDYISEKGEEQAGLDKPSKLIKKLGLYNPDEDYDTPYKAIHAALVAYDLKLNPDEMKVSIFTLNRLSNKYREQWEDIYNVAKLKSSLDEQNYPSENHIKTAIDEVINPNTNPCPDGCGIDSIITDNSPPPMPTVWDECYSGDVCVREECEDWKTCEYWGNCDDYFNRSKIVAIDEKISYFLIEYPENYDLAFEILSIDFNHEFMFDLYRISTEILNVREYGLKRYKEMADEFGRSAKNEGDKQIGPE
jgi:hypothetical protein